MKYLNTLLYWIQIAFRRESFQVSASNKKQRSGRFDTGSIYLLIKNL